VTTCDHMFVISEDWWQ